MLRRLGCFVAGLSLIGGVVGVVDGASAVVAPVVVVSPSAGLLDGQTVAATGSGFTNQTASGGTMTVDVCRSEVLAGPLNAAEDCSSEFANVQVDAAGQFSTTVIVHRTSVSVIGTPVDCTTRLNACVIFAIEIISFNGIIPVILYASAPISFRAETITDCRKNKWQGVVNAQGQAFRNQGECVAFVEQQRHAA